MALPTSGSRFEGFIVEATLGAGGFATVYLARRERDGLRVALKVLQPERDGSYDAPTRARFAREVTILAGLRSDGVVRLLDQGTSAAGLLYGAFEYLPGEDLSELLARRRMEPAEVVGVLRQLLRALREAHDAGLLHRDLKPANIRIVSPTGEPLRVKLLDFGIARSSDPGHPSVTRTGELLGTPRYMSPEQLTSQPLSPASDIYSLGMVVFEMLAGPQALGANRIHDQVERMHSGHVFSTPELERADRGLLSVVQQMTARRVEDRFPSAQAVLVALDRLPHAPGRPRAPVASTPTSTPLIRAMVAFVALAAALGIAIVVAVLRPGPAPELVPAPTRTRARVDALNKVVVAPTPVTHHPPPATVEAGASSPPPGGSVGCGLPALPPGHTRVGRAEYWVPAGYDPDIPHPLVLLVHDKWQEPLPFLRDSGFADLADAEQFVIVAPDDGSAGWMDGAVARLRREMETATEELCIDRRRVFVVSQGRGGRAAMPAACEPWVTGLAANAFIPSELFPDLWCETPKPAIWFAPTNSGFFHRGNRAPTCTRDNPLPYAELERRWKERNRSHKRGTPVPTTGGACTRWEGVAPFQSCAVDGGMWWPGVEPTLKENLDCPDEAPPNFPTTQRVWEFFESLPPLEQVNVSRP